VAAEGAPPEHGAMVTKPPTTPVGAKQPLAGQSFAKAALGTAAAVAVLWAGAHLIPKPSLDIPGAGAGGAQARQVVDRFEHGVDGRSSIAVGAVLAPDVVFVHEDGTETHGASAVSQFWGSAPAGHGLDLKDEHVTKMGLDTLVSAQATDPGGDSTSEKLTFTVGPDQRITRMVLSS
jgi:hypothetical protein